MPGRCSAATRPSHEPLPGILPPSPGPPSLTSICAGETQAASDGLCGGTQSDKDGLAGAVSIAREVPASSCLSMNEPQGSTSSPPLRPVTFTRRLEGSRVDVHEADHPLATDAEESATPASEPRTQAGPLRSIEITDLLSRRNESSSQVVQPSRPTAEERQERIDEGDAATAARDVRRNMIIAAWSGFSLLTRGRKWVLMLRMLIGLAQLAAGVVVLSLPSSLGDSYSTPETCDPEGMFVYLALHVARVLCSIPIDVYLGLSPHQTPRSRRAGAEGLMDRERNRTVGSLALDRKLGRFSDLLGLCHIVLFIVGNYIVWTSVECSRTPADSRPLWIVCVCMLSITYVIIFEVGLMVFLVVFFLPLLIAILRSLGLANRLPQRSIHPETGKINQDTIDQQSRLVYFTPALDEREHASSSREDLERLDVVADKRAVEEDVVAIATPLPLSRTSSRHSKPPSNAPTPAGPPRRKRLGLLFGFAKTARSPSEGETADPSAGDHGTTPSVSAATGETLKYPLYPIPAHRATCPICLCDFEEVHNDTRREAVAEREESPGDGEPGPADDLVEPLRLLKCGHVMHMTCVDQWLTTVSGRCPVCQKPVLSKSEAPDGDNPGRGAGQ